jgi:hypothetical protein
MDARLAKLVLMLDSESRTAASDEYGPVSKSYANGIRFALHAINTVYGTQMRDDAEEEIHLLVQEARRTLAGKEGGS